MGCVGLSVWCKSPPGLAGVPRAAVSCLCAEEGGVDRLQAMRTFMAVLETGSFTSAAASLGVGQPTVSKYVSRLESALGVALLERSTHHLSPTPAGAEYYRRCAVLLSEMSAADEAARAAGDHPCGELSVSAPASLWGLLSVRLAPLLRQAPQLSVQLLPPGAPAALSLVLRPPSDQPPLLAGVMRAYASPSWHARHGPLAEDAGWASVPRVGWPGSRGGAERLVVPGLRAAVAAAVAGVGAAGLPDWAADGLTALWPSAVGPPMPVWAVYAPQRFLPPAISSVLSCLSGQEGL